MRKIWFVVGGAVLGTLYLIFRERQPDQLDSSNGGQPRLGPELERGLASFYGSFFQGKPTASGEPFDVNKMTAAHKTLPMQTMVQVTDMDTGNSIVVRINDRGPFVAGRVIDLSQGAAQQLGIIQRGIANVSLRLA